MALPEGSTLYDLINIGIKHTYAAVGVVVRLRKELSLVKDVPVLIAIDQVRYIFVLTPVVMHCSVLSYFLFYCIIFWDSQQLSYSFLLLFSSIIIGLPSVSMRRQSQFVLLDQYMLGSSLR